MVATSWRLSAALVSAQDHPSPQWGKQGVALSTLVKTFAAASDGRAVYYPGVVRRFVEHYVPPRAKQLTE